MTSYVECSIRSVTEESRFLFTASLEEGVRGVEEEESESVMGTYLLLALTCLPLTLQLTQ